MSDNRPAHRSSLLGRCVRWLVFGGVLFGLGYWTRDRQPVDRADSPRAQVKALRAQVAWIWRWIESTPRVQSMLPREVVQKAMTESLAPLGRRMEAVQALERLGTNAWEVVPDLMGIVDGPDFGAGISAAEALARIGADRAPSWTNGLTAWDGKPRPARVFGHLLTGRNSSGQRYDEVHRRFALIGLASTGEAGADWREAVSEVVRSEEEAAIRSLALAALARVAPVHAETPALLREALENEKDWPEVRAAALTSLASIAWEDETARDRVRRALSDTNGQVRLAAARSLWRKGAAADEILPTLSGLTQHRLASIRALSVRLATEMGRLAAPIRGDIERLEGDTEESVRLAVAAWRRTGDGSQQTSTP
ncbi:MAG: HEAT repeat domain-containing protein [Verrucomicrobiales bacterium]|nr:HEAT repeat domain-containing protein [Verrucomicrobiales bacterium]